LQRVTCLETFTTASTMVGMGTIEVLDIHITTMTFTVEELAKFQMICTPPTLKATAMSIQDPTNNYNTVTII